MNNCKNCGHGVENHENFCSTCGAINLGEGSNGVDKIIKQFKYLFLNPVSFVRSGSYFNWTNTFTALGLIALLQLILLKVVGEEFGIDGLFIIVYPVLLGILCVHSFLISILSGFITKKKISFSNSLSISLFAELIFYVCLILGMILGSLISLKAFYILLVFGRLFSLMLVYQTLKSYLQAENEFVVIRTLLASSFSTLIILFLVFKSLIENSL